MLPICSSLLALILASRKNRIELTGKVPGICVVVESNWPLAGRLPRSSRHHHVCIA